MPDIAYIYVLADSRITDSIERVRYVGRTMHLVRRMRAHQQTCHAGEHTARADWMRSVYASGGNVLMEVVETTTRHKCVNAEIKWITKLRFLGARLMNLTDGGEGLLNPSPETRRRIGAAKRGHKFWVGKTHTAEAKAKMSAYRAGRPNPARKGVSCPPEVRARIAAKLRARSMSDEERAIKQEIAKRVLWSPEARAKHGLAVNTTEHRAQISARMSTPESIERTRQMGAAQRGRKHDEAFREAARIRWTGRKHKESTKQRMSEWQRGANGPRAKFTDEQITAIRTRCAAGGVSQRQLAREHMVEPRTINLIVNNKTYVVAA